MCICLALLVTKLLLRCLHCPFVSIYRPCPFPAQAPRYPHKRACGETTARVNNSRACGYHRKFPFRLCYAMTTDKSQVQQLDRLSLDLRTPCFSHGQLYVAYGRATKRKNVLTLVDEKSRSKSKIDVHYTVNIVHDVLLH